MKPRTRLHWLLMAACVPFAVHAGERARGPVLPLYKQECAACHVPYPRSALPAASWQRIMADLSSHYGTDASLDPAQVRQIGAWLSEGAHARRPQPPEDRITRSAWFLREHDEIPAATFKRPSIQGASNCAACHTRAAQGEFSEHDVRIPR